MVEMILGRSRLRKAHKNATMEALVLFFTRRESWKKNETSIGGEKGNQEEFMKVRGGDEGIHPSSKILLPLCSLILVIFNFR